MRYTVSDFLSSYGDSVRQIGGAGGMSRPIGEVGILDYELVPGLRDRYQRDNFYEGQLVLSTMLYARDDPAYLIPAAVKYLVSKGTSGLVIKNVLHLPIPEAAVRYANARDFPLFVTTAPDLYFDEVVYDVGCRVEQMRRFEFVQCEVDAMRVDSENAGQVRRHALRICPSFDDEYAVGFARCDEPLDATRVAMVERAWGQEALASHRSAVAALDDGLLFVTCEGDARALSAALGRALASVGCRLGVSSVHYDLGEFVCAVEEARNAAAIAGARGLTAVEWEGLGALRAIMPHAESASMRAFAASVLGPLEEFDAENNARLVETLRVWWECGMGAGEAARRLGQHPNTVRYRLRQVRAITGLDARVPSDAFQLAFACGVELCRELGRASPSGSYR